MARRSRFARNNSALALAAGLALAGCGSLPRFELAPKPAPAHALENPPPSADLVGRLSFREAKAEDTFVDLAIELGVGYLELAEANQEIDPWVPTAGARLVIPDVHLLPAGAREGIVVNTGDLRLYYFAPGEAPRSYPIGVAKEGFATPQGTTKVTRKQKDPTWYPGPTARRDDPSLKRAVPPGPDNRLGAYALYLGWPSYLIHGTNDPAGVGRNTSRGCIRLYPGHIEELFAAVPIGTKVRVTHEPVKTGWVAGELYLEVHPDRERALAFDQGEKLVREPARDLRALVTKAAGAELARVDWDRVARASLASAGIPVRVTQPAATVAAD
ncbi:MAG: L,D-transpeptidase family protein [Deltaproteobacteria bacterium]|nr:L,D-transpeptidase family protein [Deltaproteobacteria bacterium]